MLSKFWGIGVPGRPSGVKRIKSSGTIGLQNVYEGPVDPPSNSNLATMLNVAIARYP